MSLVRFFAVLTAVVLAFPITASGDVAGLIPIDGVMVKYKSIADLKDLIIKTVKMFDPSEYRETLKQIEDDTRKNLGFSILDPQEVENYGIDPNRELALYVKGENDMAVVIPVKSKARFKKFIKKQKIRGEAGFYKGNYYILISSPFLSRKFKKSKKISQLPNYKEAVRKLGYVHIYISSKWFDDIIKSSMGQTNQEMGLEGMNQRNQDIMQFLSAVKTIQPQCYAFKVYWEGKKAVVKAWSKSRYKTTETRKEGFEKSLAYYLPNSVVGFLYLDSALSEMQIARIINSNPTLQLISAMVNGYAVQYQMPTLQRILSSKVLLAVAPRKKRYTTDVDLLVAVKFKNPKDAERLNEGLAMMVKSLTAMNNMQQGQQQTAPAQPEVKITRVKNGYKYEMLEGNILTSYYKTSFIGATEGIFSKYLSNLKEGNGNYTLPSEVKKEFRRAISVIFLDAQSLVKNFFTEQDKKDMEFMTRMDYIYVSTYPDVIGKPTYGSFSILKMSFK